MSSAVELLGQAQSLLAQEATHLDAGRFDEWLSLYAPGCVYWVPTWTSFDVLAVDPQTELSHIYYPNRAGLEDRIARLRSKSSPASMPMPRTAHILGHAVLREEPSPERVSVQVPWATHVYYPAAQDQHTFFGISEVDVAPIDGHWRIVGKKIILQNDYVPGMLDVYCL